MKHDPSDDPVPLGLHLRMDGSREVDDELPLLCRTMFTLGVWGGILRIPTFGRMLLLTPLIRHGCPSGTRPIPFSWLAALIAMGEIAALGTAGNVSLLDRTRHALALGYGALAVSALSFAYWLFPLAGMVHDWINEDSGISLLIAGLLLIRLTFLIAYGFALLQYRDWEACRWY